MRPVAPQSGHEHIFSRREHPVNGASRDDREAFQVLGEGLVSRRPVRFQQKLALLLEVRCVARVLLPIGDHDNRRGLAFELHD